MLTYSITTFSTELSTVFVHKMSLCCYFRSLELKAKIILMMLGYINISKLAIQKQSLKNIRVNRNPPIIKRFNPMSTGPTYEIDGG
jgi:hypothetical protein